MEESSDSQRADEEVDLFLSTTILHQYGSYKEGGRKDVRVRCLVQSCEESETKDAEGEASTDEETIHLSLFPSRQYTFGTGREATYLGEDDTSTDGDDGSSETERHELHSGDGR